MRVANVGLRLGTTKYSGEQQIIEFAVGYWLQCAFEDASGMDKDKFPTEEDMKKYSDAVSLNQKQEKVTRKEEAASLTSNPGPQKKQKVTKKLPQLFHGDEACPDNKKKYLLSFPLTVAMLNATQGEKNTKVISQRKLKAYKLCINNKSAAGAECVNARNAVLHEKMVAYIIKHGGSVAKPTHWTATGVIEIK